MFDVLLEKNPYYKIGPTGFGWAAAPAYGALMERYAEPTEKAFSRNSDYLDKFIEAKKQKYVLCDPLPGK